MGALVLPLVLMLSLSAQRSPDEGFVEVGVWYAGPGVEPADAPATDLAALRSDLADIRRAGFNGITTWIAWRDAEPRKGSYALSGLERLVAAAVAADLRVSLVVYDDPPPDWAASERDGSKPFLGYLSTRLSLQPGILRIVRHSAALDAPPARITVRPGSGPEARLTMWSQIARGARAISFTGTGGTLSAELLALGETAGVISRNQALFAPLRPRNGGVTSIAADGGGPAVDVKLLESAEALMIVGLNYGPAPRKATITFAADIPEAIWQNLETGTSVSFVMSKDGPVLEYTFGPRDALVLMIRKKLR